MIRGKKGDVGGDDSVLPMVMYIILNIVAFSVVGLWVNDAATGGFVYEQAYSKQIALLIDSAKPGQEIVLNFSEGFEVAEDNDFALEKTLRFDQENNRVFVQFLENRGHSYSYFNSLPLSSKREGDLWTIRVGGENDS